MANFFSSEYFAAVFFKAMGGQETDADPNALSGSFSGSSDFTAIASSNAPAIVEEVGGWFWPDVSYAERLNRKRRLDREDESLVRELFERKREAPPQVVPPEQATSAETLSLAERLEASRLPRRLSPTTAITRIFSLNRPLKSEAQRRAEALAEQERQNAIAAAAEQAALLQRIEAERIAAWLRDEDDVLALLLAA